MLKLPHNCTISHASKVMLKIFQARLQQYKNRELTERTPQTQQFKQDEETEEYPADKGTG